MSVQGAQGCRAAGLFLLMLCSDAAAAPFREQPSPAAGTPIRQTFLDEDASHLRTPQHTACVTSRTIDIARSRYTDPDTGAPVPFGDVVRSFATSAQFIATRPDDAQSSRVQLKYSPRPDAPITLTVDGRSRDVAAALEASGDSIRITDPEMLDTIRASFERGEAVELSATSRATGRAVTDSIAGMRFEGYDACRAGLSPEPDAPPSSRIAFDFEATPDPALRATDHETTICRVEDPTAQLYRGRLLWTTGFFSQTRDIFVTFADSGDVAEIYVPGIVEGRRERSGAMATHLSIAANANDPTQVATVSGCLGGAPVALCEDPAGGLGECIGALAGDDLFEDAAFLSNFEIGNPATGTVAGPTILARATPGSGGAFGSGVGGSAGGGFLAGLSGGSGGGGIPGGGSVPGGSVPGSTPGGPPPGGGGGTLIPTPIPLPLSGWLLAAGLAGLAGVRWLGSCHQRQA